MSKGNNNNSTQGQHWVYPEHKAELLCVRGKQCSCAPRKQRELVRAEPGWKRAHYDLPKEDPQPTDAPCL